MAKPSPSAFTPEVKELIWARSYGRCDRCGIHASTAHFHHRNPRRMGGSDNPSLGLPSNGLILHPGCHDYIERKRKVAAQLGFLLGSLVDPKTAPVYTGWANWVWLLEDGGYVKIDGVPTSGVEPPSR